MSWLGGTFSKKALSAKKRIICFNSWLITSIGPPSNLTSGFVIPLQVWCFICWTSSSALQAGTLEGTPFFANLPPHLSVTLNPTASRHHCESNKNTSRTKSCNLRGLKLFSSKVVGLSWLTWSLTKKWTFQFVTNLFRETITQTEVFCPPWRDVFLEPIRQNQSLTKPRWKQLPIRVTSNLLK